MRKFEERKADRRKMAERKAEFFIYSLMKIVSLQCLVKDLSTGQYNQYLWPCRPQSHRGQATTKRAIRKKENYNN